jgi:alkylation response protein AidB-like acyl-CoA dehydrogenase
MARVQEIAADVIATNAQSVDKDARWPEAGIRALQQAGLGGLTIPEELGGSARVRFEWHRCARSLAGNVPRRQCVSVCIASDLPCFLPRRPPISANVTCGR